MIWCPVMHLHSISLIIVHPASTSCFKEPPDHRSAFITLLHTGRLKLVVFCVQSHSIDKFWLNYVTSYAEKCHYMSFWCMICCYIGLHQVVVEFQSFWCWIGLQPLLSLNLTCQMQSKPWPWISILMWNMTQTP